MIRPVLILTGECCRKWPILALANIGRCGYCGERPVVVADRPPWELE